MLLKAQEVEMKKKNIKKKNFLESTAATFIKCEKKGKKSFVTSAAVAKGGGGEDENKNLRRVRQEKVKVCSPGAKHHFSTIFHVAASSGHC